MSYYRGDYYRGDYYRGDPGMFSFIEKGVKSIARAVIPGAGVAIDAYRAITSGGRKPAAAPMALQGPVMQGPAVHLPGGTSVSLGQIQLPSIGGMVGSLIPSFGPSSSAPGGACPKGMRLNKSGYFLQDGTFVPPQSRCVRYRSMNPLNPRALRKGLSRAEAFEKIARRTVNGLRSGAKKFKTKGRKR